MSVLLKSSDVARRLNVSPSTVARWVAAGRLRAVRTPGGTLRFRPEDVEALLIPTEPTDGEAIEATS